MTQFDKNKSAIVSLSRDVTKKEENKRFIKAVIIKGRTFSRLLLVDIESENRNRGTFYKIIPMLKRTF